MSYTKNRNTSPFPRQRIFKALRAATGRSYDCYLSQPFERAITNRIDRIGDDFDAYLKLLERDTDEARALEREALVGLTTFFRDPEAFQALRQQIVPQLLEDREDNRTLRIWVPGCSTGQEAFSLGILLAELQRETDRPFSFRIAGTDINHEALRYAQRGRYHRHHVRQLSSELCERYLPIDGDQHRVCTGLRNNTLFFIHDVLTPPPLGQLDLISCRNLLIFLRTSFQRRVLTSFAESLKGGGLLFVGASENTHDGPDCLTLIDMQHRIFQCSKE